MRTLPAGLTTELAEPNVSLCRLIQITRKDGTIKRLAESQGNLVSGGQTFTAAKGIRMSSIIAELNGGASTVNFEVTAAVGGFILPADLRNGLYDTAHVVISACSQVTPNNVVVLWRGTVGEIEIVDRGLIKFEAIGLLAKARAIPTTPYMPTCRHHFGDPGCGFDLGSVTVSTTISSVSGFNVTVGTAPGAEFRLGMITPTTGAGVGEGFEIREVAGAVLKTYLPTAGKLTAGDAVDLTPGCDFTFDGTQGCTFWNNEVNFGGFPDVPGADALSITFTDWS
jgi:uncharacterized phage protein (TIGR02218 family)